MPQLIPVAAFSRECITATPYTTAASDQGGTSATVFKIMVACTRIRVQYVNYYVAAPNEITTSLSPITIQASCQAVSDTGTPIAMTFGAQTSFVLNPGAQIYTDFFTGSFAAGQFVQIRTYATVATVGQVIPVNVQPLSNSSIVSGYTGTDGDNYKQHNTGTGANTLLTAGAASLWRTSTAQQFAYGPICIDGYATDGLLRPIVSVVGDSIIQGAFDGFVNDGTQGAHIRSLVGMNAPYYQMGMNGESCFRIVQNGIAYTQRMQRVARSTVVIEEYGTNDLNNVGATYPQLQAFKLSWWQYLAVNGQAIIPVTLLPRVGGTITATTTQTANGAAAAFQSYNAWLRAPASAGAGNSARFDAAAVGVNIPFIIDAASTVETGLSNALPGGPSAPSTGNLWYCGTGNSVAYTQEGIHPLTNATLLMKVAYDAAQAAIFATAPVLPIGLRFTRRI